MSPAEHPENVFAQDDHDQTTDSDPDAMSGQKSRYGHESASQPACVFSDDRQWTIGAPAPAREEDEKNEQRLPYGPDDEICQVVLLRSRERVDDQEEENGDGD